MMMYLAGHSATGCSPYKGGVPVAFRFLALMLGAWQFARVHLIDPGGAEKELIVPVRFGICPCRKSYVAFGRSQGKLIRPISLLTTTSGQVVHRESAVKPVRLSQPLYALPLFLL